MSGKEIRWSDAKVPGLMLVWQAVRVAFKANKIQFKLIIVS